MCPFGSFCTLIITRTQLYQEINHSTNPFDLFRIEGIALYYHCVEKFHLLVTKLYLINTGVIYDIFHNDVPACVISLGSFDSRCSS